MSLKNDIKLQFGWVFTESFGLSSIKDSEKVVYANNDTIPHGRLWHSQRVLAGSASETLDLTALPITPFGSDGAEIEFGIIYGLYIHCEGTSEDAIWIGAAASTAWAGFFNATNNKIILPGNSAFSIYAPSGFIVLPDVSNNLKIENPVETPVEYQIAIIGALPPEEE